MSSTNISNMKKLILVTGATGQQGSGVIDALLALKIPNLVILALTRDAQSRAAKSLAQKSASAINLIEGNLDDVPGLFQKVRRAYPDTPIWGVFSVQVSLGPGVSMESEIKQGKSLVDGSIKAGVKHFVYTSVERGGDEKSWTNSTPIPHFQSKYEIEQYLREATEDGQPGASMGWTVLRPVAFMENLVPGFQTKVFVAALRNTLTNGKKLQFVSTTDIGVFAAKAFEKPEEWDHKAVGLAGDELSVDQMNETFKKAVGIPVPETYWFFGSALTTLAGEMGTMLAWFASDGYEANIQMRRKEYPGLLTLENWLKEKSGWKS